MLNSKLYPHIFVLLNDSNIDHNLHEKLATSLINLLYMFNNNNVTIVDNDKLLLLSLKENILKLGNAFNTSESTKQIEK